jgi:ankyrin repeat protein
MSVTDELLGSFEGHSPEGIREALDAGANPVEPIRGKKPIDWLIEMYTRSPRFGECLRVMLDAGSVTDDPLFEAVLLDDDAALRRLLKASGQNLERKLSLECAYTSLKGVSALHVCAEYNSVRCAAALIEAGMDVNVRADRDREGMGGQTPLFHAVNSNQNHCRPVMELLVEAGADLDIRLKGLVWGAGFEWETVVFDVTPLSYAQCGLYAQFHRREEDVYSNLAYLYQRRDGSAPQIRNVPNKYLLDDRVFPPRT